jgi:IclR family pca regulon transcriptional regulator
MGRMLLAGLADAQALQLLRAQPLEARTRHTLTDPQAVLAKVQQARRQGWCLVNQELEEGLVSMAAPIVNRAGRVIASINISGQVNRTSPRVMQDTMLTPLREAAREISQRLAGA